MKRPARMFLAQNRMNEVIAYCILADVVIGFLLKKFHGPATVLPLAILYLMNIIVILGVYRFWKVPMFEWDDKGFILYGISPFKKERGAWRSVEKGGFKAVELKAGKVREFLIITYVSPAGQHRTGTVPMDWVGFRPRVKEEMLRFLKDKGIPGI